MKVVLFGAGAFGLPTFERLHAMHDVALVVSQPDRPAGRGRTTTPNPVSQWAMAGQLPLHRSDNVNRREDVELIRAVDSDAWVVIAFGQKLGSALLDDRFAINLHGSLLPRWRGAAPIHHAVMAGDDVTGVSVITLAATMDAGDVLGQARLPIDPSATTGDLHDALAQLGPDAVESVLRDHAQGTLTAQQQHADAVTQAGKLSRSDAVIDFNAGPDTVRGRINGLSPWPGVAVDVDGRRLKLLRADRSDDVVGPGHLTAEGVLGCAGGSVRVLDVQPQGKRPMPFSDWANGQQWDGPIEVQP
ncbi:MAG: methionyl-tRNA formyltransferase [Phycisphaerales bacterium]|nr:methionyl-tRNA formyltransferase [Phycisphaerales bacterium]